MPRTISKIQRALIAFGLCVLLLGTTAGCARGPAIVPDLPPTPPLVRTPTPSLSDKTPEQPPDLPLHIPFQHLTPEQGLSQGLVRYILQDSQGFMWFVIDT